MSEKKLFKLQTTLPSGNEYTSDNVFKIEPEIMAENIMYFKGKFKDIKVKFKCVVIDRCNLIDIVSGKTEVKSKMAEAIAAALQVEAKIQYGEELTAE